MAAAAAIPRERTRERTPVSYKVDLGVRKNVDLLSSTLGIDKSAVIERAVRLLAEHHRDELRHYLDEAREAIDRGGDWAVAEALTGKKANPTYRGGRPSKRA